MRTIFIVCLLVFSSYFGYVISSHVDNAPGATSLASLSQPDIDSDYYTKSVQPIFNARCIACHSCLESPCQLNLQAFEGVQRGAIHGKLVYEGDRLNREEPTRLFEDEKSIDGWRKRGFYDVVGNSQFSLLLSSVSLANGSRSHPTDEVKENQLCSRNQKEFEENTDEIDKVAMPYGLPALSAAEQSILQKWVTLGTPGPKRKNTQISEQLQPLVEAWESFLNKTDLRSQIVARYLFEHLFLAHLYDPKFPREFLKLVRSKTACPNGVDIISTRRPNEDPGGKFFYCLIKDPMTTVDKTHIPYEFSLQKLEWMKKNFYSDPWEIQSLPQYTTEAASNPFITFQNIPVRSRYRFLLKDAQYEVMTFIKGPVCNGTPAVGAIQDQFYVFFMDPNSDLMSMSKKYEEQVKNYLDLPGKFNSQVGGLATFSAYSNFIDNRNRYRIARSKELETYRPNGLSLQDIWDGEGENKNAILTIIRNDDNARVVKGILGDIPKTAQVLDYAVFERLVYNLVVNFDVYGNIGHQFLTRSYMDLLRMDGEDNFIDFLPNSERIKTKKDWYRGFFTQQKLDLFDQNQFSKVDTQVPYSGKDSAKVEFIKQVLFTRVNSAVRGSDDVINWKRISTKIKPDEFEARLSRITSQALPYVKYFPETAYIVLLKSGQFDRVFSLVKNREHQNMSWIMAEGIRREEKEDTLMISSSYLTSHPNQIYVVEEEQLDRFSNDIQNLRSKKEYSIFKAKFGLDRLNQNFWKVYDFLMANYKETDPINAGYLDLSRYTLE